MIYKAEIYRDYGDKVQGGTFEKVMTELFIAKSHKHAKELMARDYEHTKVIVRTTGINEPDFTLEEYPYWDFDGYKAFMDGIEA